MTTVSGPITLIACTRDRPIVADPRVRYQPTVICGRHYRPTLIAPHPQPGR
ncbi:hypothetical protein ACIHDR_46915 [Nocardia sp. NPDC052278]|uniref:hypothetical protein n=1 Tax=unclassified Nocardia TaxID=2637762 RepID=UPI0036C6F15D